MDTNDTTVMILDDYAAHAAFFQNMKPVELIGVFEKLVNHVFDHGFSQDQLRQANELKNIHQFFLSLTDEFKVEMWKIFTAVGDKHLQLPAQDELLRRAKTIEDLDAKPGDAYIGINVGSDTYYYIVQPEDLSPCDRLLRNLLLNDVLEAANRVYDVPAEEHDLSN